jgi:hypothetical protein
LAILFLGGSAAVFGRWVEEGGPRRAMFTAALCFAGGFLVSALGVYLHQLWVIYLGYGVIGGTGLGIGYVSPVSTLVRWFPDRPGMATAHQHGRPATDGGRELERRYSLARVSPRWQICGATDHDRVWFATGEEIVRAWAAIGRDVLGHHKPSASARPNSVPPAKNKTNG